MTSEGQIRRRIGAGVVCFTLVAAVGISCAVPVDDSEEELAWTSEPLARSTNPPGGLTPAQVPQFVSITFDDNFTAEGMNWATDTFRSLRNPAGSGNADTFDNALVRASFYHNCTYLAGAVQTSWATAVADGHETGDHTTNHSDGLNFTTAQWTNEIDPCRTQLMNAFGLTAQQVSGFRAPFLRYNNDLFTVLESRSPAFAYDTSIPSCLGDSEDGTNCAWPYTLEVPSVDAANRRAKNPIFPEVLAHPGFWEMPNPVVIVPESHRAGIPAEQFIGGTSTGKILGMDISMFYDARMTKAQSLAALKNTLDLHLAGNRAPIIFVAHTHVYAASWDGNVPQISLADRKAVITEFMQYALSKPAVRIRPVADILKWMKNPVALGGSQPPDVDRTENGTPSASSTNVCNTSTETIDRAYDNANTTKWCIRVAPTSAAPLSTAYDFAGSDTYVVTSYKITTGNDVPERDPRDWQLQGCPTSSCSVGSDASWVTLDTRTNEFASAARGQTNTYTLSNSTAYQMYRLRFTANRGATTLTQLAEIQMFGAPGGSSCTPTTCAAQGKNCGSLSDGCGGTLSCGTCSGGQTCGGGGTPNVCGGNSCVPTTCAAQGKNCGAISDGCGGTLSCGTCSGGQTCGGGGTANVCGGGGSCSGTVSSYTQAKCNSTAVFSGKLYKCISQAAGVNGEPSGCGTAGVYCSTIEPTNAAWGSTAWQLLQSCP